MGAILVEILRSAEQRHPEMDSPGLMSLVQEELRCKTTKGKFLSPKRRDSLSYIRKKFGFPKKLSLNNKSPSDSPSSSFPSSPINPKVIEKGLVIAFLQSENREDVCERDEANVERLFSGREFCDLDLCKDYDVEEMHRKLDSLKIVPEEAYSFLLFYISAHGKGNGRILAKNRRSFDTGEIVETMNCPENLPGFRNKPKLLILETCRGRIGSRPVSAVSESDSGIILSNAGASHPAAYIAAPGKDCYVVHAALPECASLCDKEIGYIIYYNNWLHCAYQLQNLQELLHPLLC